MKKFLLSILNDVGAAIFITAFGSLAIKTSSTLLAILLWFVVYLILDLHVYLNNKLKNSFNVFY